MQKFSFLSLMMISILLSPVLLAQENGYSESYKNGIYEKGFYLNGQKDGIWLYELKNGNLSLIESYKEGIKQGAFIEFDKGGYITKQSYFADWRKFIISPYTDYYGQPP